MLDFEDLQVEIRRKGATGTTASFHLPRKQISITQEEDATFVRLMLERLSSEESAYQFLRQLALGEPVEVCVKRVDGTTSFHSDGARVGSQSVNYFIGSDQMGHALAADAEYEGPFSISFFVMI